jgi:hypothetical protein
VRATATGATIVIVLIEFMDDDKGYIAWLADHPEGCVLNCGRPPQPSYLMLHKATCGTISGKPGRRWTVAYQKVCAETFKEIEAWTRPIGSPSGCRFCKPC